MQPRGGRARLAPYRLRASAPGPGPGAAPGPPPLAPPSPSPAPSQQVPTYASVGYAGTSNGAPRMSPCAQAQAPPPGAGPLHHFAGKHLLAASPQGGYFIIRQTNAPPQMQPAQNEARQFAAQSTDQPQYYFQSPPKLANQGVVESFAPIQLSSSSLGYQQYLQQHASASTSQHRHQQQQQQQQHHQQQQQQQQQVFHNLQPMFVLSNQNLGAIQSDQFKFLTQFEPPPPQERRFDAYEYPVFVPQNDYARPAVVATPKEEKGAPSDAGAGFEPAPTIVVGPDVLRIGTPEVAKSLEPPATDAPDAFDKRSPQSLKRLPEAKVKPNVLTHVINGHVIKEYASRPATLEERKPAEAEVVGDPPKEAATANAFLDAEKIAESKKKRRPSKDERRETVRRWTVDDVGDRLKLMPLASGYADEFAKHEIDGECLPMLNPEHLVVAMSLPLGVALKIVKEIRTLILSI